MLAGAVRISDELRALERHLAQQARQVSVLEELGLTHADYRFLKEEVAALFRASPSRALTRLSRHGRYSTAAFLALVGVYEYARDDGSAKYWPHVAEALSVRSVPQGDFGRLVERVVRTGGMAAFPKAEGGRRFVDLILLHGGIPNGCLGSYFDRVLRHAHPSLSGQEIIGAVLEPTQERYLLKPVARYLRYGGDVAADFVERTVDLGVHDRELREAEDPCPDVLHTVASEVGLPVRVVKGYRDWLRTAPERGRTRARGRHWRRPSLRYDPLHLAPVVDLPAQEVGELAASGTWTLWLGDEAVTLEVQAWRRAQGWRTEAHVHALVSPQAHYDVAWSSAKGDGRWSLLGVSLRWPLLAFHARDGLVVDVAEGLPKDEVWILRPESHPFTCDGASLLEEGVQLEAGWRGYVVERWDLRGCSAEAAPHVGDVKLWVRPEGDLRPHLLGRTLPGVTSDDTPVYRMWPRVAVPRARPDEDLGRWSLRWTATAGALVEEGEVAVEDVAKDTGAGWEIDLGAADLPACGTLSMRLRGPLGRSARFSLSVWEGLRVDGAGRLVLPDEEGPKAASLVIDLPARLEIRSIDGRNHEAIGSHVEVEVGAHADAVTLRVGSDVGVYPLKVAVPRLRSHAFDAALGSVSTALATAAPLHIQGDWLDQAALPRVAFMTGHSGVSVDALEADFGGADVVACPRAAGRADVFDLAELAQAAASRRRARARLFVRVRRQRVPVGSWHARLGLRGLQAVAVEDPEGTTVNAHWDAGHLVEDVVARLWSVWSPWDDQRESVVERNGPASCTARFEAVPPGQYLLELAVEDPWTQSAARRPAASAPEVTLIEVGSEAERLVRLACAEGVRGHVARYLAASGDPVGRAEAWRQACEVASPEDVPLLLSVAGLEAGEDPGMRLASAQQDRLFDFLEPVVEVNRSSVVAALAGDEVRTLAAYATVLGFFDAPPEDWGGVWEPLALCGAGLDVLGDAHRAARMCQRLGLELVLGVGDPLEEEEPPEEEEREVGLAEFAASRDGFGDRPNDAFAAMAVRQIKDIRTMLGLVPGGVLSPQAQQLGYADWLIGRASDPDASENLARNTSDLKSDLRTLLAVDANRFERVVGYALAREHHLASGGEAEMWLNVPFAVGATAVLLRAQALHPAARGALGGHRRWIRSVALRALRAAPDLFVHDLCWVHLELVST